MIQSPVSSFLRNNDEIYGVALGSDRCAEHERGIKDISSLLGIPRDTIKKKFWGVRGYTVTKFPRERFEIACQETHSRLLFGLPYFFPSWENPVLESAPDEVSGAWSKNDFGIVVNNQYRPFLEQLFAAFGKKDVAMWVGGGNAFGGHALVIAVASRIPEPQSRELGDNIRSQAKLELAMRASKIREALKRAKKNYYALSPSWQDKESSELLMWLNPCDHERYNYGWFTLADLQAWCHDQGPIIKMSQPIAS